MQGGLHFILYLYNVGKVNLYKICKYVVDDKIRLSTETELVKKWKDDLSQRVHGFIFTLTSYLAHVLIVSI